MSKYYKHSSKTQVQSIVSIISIPRSKFILKIQTYLYDENNRSPKKKRLF